MTIKLNGTIDRTRGYRTPTEADNPCPYFKNRFIEHGRMNERRAICELDVAGVICDYRLVQPDGTPICARYVHWPNYEIVEDAPVVDGLMPVPYAEANKHQEQEKDANGNPLFWDHNWDPPEKTTVDTGDPVMIDIYDKRVWFTKQWVDTHEKIFRVRDHKIGWYHDV